MIRCDENKITHLGSPVCRNRHPSKAYKTDEDGGDDDDDDDVVATKTMQWS